MMWWIGRRIGVVLRKVCWGLEVYWGDEADELVVISPIRIRLDALRRKMDKASNTNTART
jgi:hypothetical protein